MPPSFSRSARTAWGVRPLSAAWRSTSWSTSPPVTSIASRPAIVVEHERPADGVGRRCALLLAERVPVDARLPGVDLFLQEAPGDLLDAAVQLAPDQRFRHLDRDPVRELSQQVLAHLVVRLGLGLRPQIGVDLRPQRGQIVELADRAGELVVEIRQHRPLHVLDLDRVGRLPAREPADGVVLRVGHRERARRARLQSDQLVVEPGRIRVAADLDAHPLEMLRRRARLVRQPPLEIDGQHVAPLRRALGDRFQLRAPLAQPLDGLLHGAGVHRDRLLAQRERGIVARVDLRVPSRGAR